MPRSGSSVGARGRTCLHDRKPKAAMAMSKWGGRALIVTSITFRARIVARVRGGSHTAYHRWSSVVLWQCRVPWPGGTMTTPAGFGLACDPCAARSRGGARPTLNLTLVLFVLVVGLSLIPTAQASEANISHSSEVRVVDEAGKPVVDAMVA